MSGGMRRGFRRLSGIGVYPDKCTRVQRGGQRGTGAPKELWHHVREGQAAPWLHRATMWEEGTLAGEREKRIRQGCETRGEWALPLTDHHF